jgi:hypothetical protein
MLVVVSCRRAAGPAVPSLPDDAGPASPAERGRVLTIVYSSALRGEYEPCGCPSHPLGGIARRATVIDRARAEADGVVVVDAGNLLLPAAVEGPGVAPPDLGEQERRARLLLAGLVRSGLTAFSPGENDLLLGPERLASLAAEAKAPVVSANLARAGALLFPATRLVEAAGVKVGVLGLVVPSARAAERWRAWDVEARPALPAVQAAVRELRGRGAELVVALAAIDGGLAAARDLFRQADGVDFAVLGSGNQRFDAPEPAGRTRLLAAFELGRQLGRLDLHLVGFAGLRGLVDRGERAQLLEIRRSLRAQLDDLEKRRARADTDELKRYFGERGQGFRDELGRVEARLAGLPARIEGSWFDNAILDLDADVPDQPGVAALVRAYDEENARRGRRGLPVGVRARTNEEAAAQKVTAAKLPSAGAGNGERPATDDPATLRYAGTDACGACHAPALAFWRTTLHARAFATLQHAGRAGDPGCVVCHATGFARGGGPTTVTTAASRFAAVGCEACHGPGLAHVSAADKRGSIARAVPATVCLGCHTADQTNGEFDYAKFLPAVRGPGHGAR